MLVVGFTNVPVVTSLIKGKIQFLKQKNFIEADVALGLPTSTILLKHILWHNCRSLLIIEATLGMAEAILMETSLSYLGFGVQEPTPSWETWCNQAPTISCRESSGHPPHRPSRSCSRFSGFICSATD